MAKTTAAELLRDRAKRMRDACEVQRDHEDVLRLDFAADVCDELAAQIDALPAEPVGARLYTRAGVLAFGERVAREVRVDVMIDARFDRPTPDERLVTIVTLLLDAETPS